MTLKLLSLSQISLPNLTCISNHLLSIFTWISNQNLKHNKTKIEFLIFTPPHLLLAQLGSN